MSLVPHSLRTMLAGPSGFVGGPVEPPFPIPPRDADQWLLDPAFGPLFEFSEGHNRWIARDATRTGTRRQLRSGFARVFDGAATQFNFSPITNGLSQLAIAVLAWFDPVGDDEWQTLFFGGESDDFNAFAWLNRTTLNNIQFRPGGGVGGTGPTFAIPSGQWVWVGISMDGANVAHYIDEQRVDDTMAGGTITTGARSQIGRLGESANVFAFNGEIAEYRIFEHSITDEQWDEIRAGNPNVGTPVAFYKCDEESGITMLSSVSSNHAVLREELTWPATVSDQRQRIRSWSNEVGYSGVIRWPEGAEGTAYINPGAHPGDLGTNSWLFEARVRHSNIGGNRTLFGKNTNVNLLYNGTSGVFQLRIGGASNGVNQVFTFGTSRLLEPAALRVDYDGLGTVRFWENGLLLATETMSAPNDNAPDGDMLLGGLTVGTPFGGDISDARFEVNGQELWHFNGDWVTPTRPLELTRLGVPEVVGDIRPGAVPRDENNTAQDIYGDPLQFVGQAPRDAYLQTPLCRFGENVSSRAILTEKFPLSNETFTIGCWARRTTPNAGRNQCLFQREENLGFGFRLWLIDTVDGTVRFDVGSSQGSYSQVTYTPPGGTSDTSWHHYAASFDEGSRWMRLYYDGVLVGEFLKSFASPLEIADLTLGNFVAGGGQWEGQIYGVTAANTELTPEQIRELAFGDLFAAESLIDFFPCQDGQGFFLNGRLDAWEFELFNLDPSFAWDAAGLQSRFNDWPYVAACPTLDGEAIELRNAPPINSLPAGDFSFSVWVRPVLERGVNGWIVGNSNGATAGWHARVTDEDKIRFAVLSNGSNYRIVDSDVVDTERMHHVVGNWDRAASRTRIWIDGVEQSLTFIDLGTITATTSSQNTRIGVSPEGGTPWPYSGQIAGLDIFGGQLSQSEIEYLFTRGEIGSAPTAQVIRSIDLTEDAGDLHFDRSEFHENGEAPIDLPRLRQSVVVPDTPAYTHCLSMLSTTDHVAMPVGVAEGPTIGISCLIGRVRGGANGQTISRGAAGDFNFQLRINADNSLQVWQFQSTGATFRDTTIPNVFSTWRWTTIKVEMSLGRMDIWINGALTSNTNVGAGSWNNTGGVLRIGQRFDGESGGIFSIRSVAISHTVTGLDRDDYERSHEDDVLFLPMLETSTTVDNVRDIAGNRLDARLVVDDIAGSRGQRCGLELPTMSVAPLLVTGQALDHWGENPNSPFADRLDNAGLPRFFSARDDEDFPLVSNRRRFTRIRGDGKDRLIVDVDEQDVDGLMDYTRRQP